MCKTKIRGSSVSEARRAIRQINLVVARPRDTDRDWVQNAACKDVDPDELFTQGAAQRKSVAICRHCTVMQQCAADALDNQVEYGVWGGMTERQRRALLKQHPEVVSWSSFLDKRAKRSVG